MTNERKKISVIGSGFTGATAAFLFAQKELGNVVLVDIPQNENPTKGKALDILESGPILGFNTSVKGTSSYEDTRDSDIVIITAGIARKPGMSRDDLVQTNQQVMQSVTKEIVKFSPNAILLVLTNPVDAMTYTVFQASGFPKERVIGQSGVLDTARFRTFVAEALSLAPQDITGFVLGGHGDDMVPLIRYSYAGGIPIDTLLSPSEIEAIVERTRKGGAEIVNLLGNGSAYYAPAAALVEMAEAILNDQKRVLPSIAYLEGEYGFDGIYIGVPTVLGAKGIEQIIELELSDEEKSAFSKSAESVRSVMNSLRN
ncbi:malate dehydrogenase [Paenisporosarcina cavernae]|uniref:Malate dehydrogenase n=1 Tax=Paenisporosarcina cavernae TaxID=2320858 RepID=A0A385YSN6_9BACL|nr:malate dehydrogenase [Paenisporosarcina cavernae]AYC29829.1 malate dehydrogenase [Paenisporosarcina cavernae]